MGSEQLSKPLGALLDEISLSGTSIAHRPYTTNEKPAQRRALQSSQVECFGRRLVEQRALWATMARLRSVAGPSFVDGRHLMVVMGLLEAGHVVLRYAFLILGVLRLFACVMCSRVPVGVEG